MGSCSVWSCWSVSVKNSKYKKKYSNLVTEVFVLVYRKYSKNTWRYSTVSIYSPLPHRHTVYNTDTCIRANQSVHPAHR